MLDSFKVISGRIKPLKIPSAVIGVVSLVAVMLIILNSKSYEGDRYLIPSIAGFIWSLSLYLFIVVFQDIPQEAHNGMRFFQRIKRRILRAWYWLIAFIFTSATLATLMFSVKLLFTWMRDYLE